MSANLLRRPQIIPSVLIVILGAVVVWLAQGSARGAQDERNSGSAERVRQLRIERRDLLRQMVIGAQSQFREGRVSVEEVAEVELALQRSELDLCNTNQERVRVHEKTVAVMRRLESHANAKYRAGTAVQMEAMKSKVRLLSAEIELEQARLEANSPTGSKSAG